LEQRDVRLQHSGTESRVPAPCHYKICSGTEAVTTDVPDIVYVIEEKLRKQAKVSILGKWKAAKSFLAIQMGMAIAAGEEFLGFKTTASNVLYINFEISEEMFQQRVQDAHRVLGFDLVRFRYVSINELCLDLDTEELNAMLEQCLQEGFNVEVLIIDPRWKAITRDSNQDEVVRAFCVNLDRVISQYKLTVIVIHHEGAATASDKAGKGSTVFEAWLDGWFKIKPFSSNPKMRELDIWSRDSERQSVTAEFDYPIHKVRPELVAERKAKTSEVKTYILNSLAAAPMLESELRFAVLIAGHSAYAFWRARGELVQEGRSIVTKASGQGNRKMLSITEKGKLPSIRY
jgi:hypothetical protein